MEENSKLKINLVAKIIVTETPQTAILKMVLMGVLYHVGIGI